MILVFCIVAVMFDVHATALARLRADRQRYTGGRRAIV